MLPDFKVFININQNNLVFQQGRPTGQWNNTENETHTDMTS